MKSRISEAHFHYLTDALKRTVAEFHKRNSGVSDADIIKGKLITELVKELRSVILRFFRIIPPGSKTPITPEDTQEFKLTLINRAMVYGLNAQLDIIANEKLIDETLKAVFEIDNADSEPNGEKGGDETAEREKPPEFKLADFVLPLEEGAPGLSY